MDEPFMLDELHCKIQSFLKEINQNFYWNAAINEVLGYVIVHRLAVDSTEKDVKIEHWDVDALKDDVDVLKDNLHLSSIESDMKGHEYRSTIIENITKSDSDDQKGNFSLAAVELDLEAQPYNNDAFESTTDADGYDSKSHLQEASKEAILLKSLELNMEESDSLLEDIPENEKVVTKGPGLKRRKNNSLYSQVVPLNAVNGLFCHSGSMGSIC